MSESNLPGLFPMTTDEGTNVVPLHGTGIMPSQKLLGMIEDKNIASIEAITPGQVQPASLDLRFGNRAYRVRASFLPGPDFKVMDRVRELDGLPPIDLSNGAVFEKGAVYVVEIQETLRLPKDIAALANPKSSTGRLDVLTRLITDGGTAFDKVDGGYKGGLFVEVVPLTFSIVVSKGSRLNQLRFFTGRPELPIATVQKEYDLGRLVNGDGERLPLRGPLVPLTVDLQGTGPNAVVGYKAKKDTIKIDIDKIAHYDPRDFWDIIKNDGGRLFLDKNDFYVLATKEDVGVPPRLAAEMVPFDPGSGEFRVHYAGFFDPGFGWSGDRASGSKAVLEVRSHGVPFMLEHGQIVGWLRYSQIAGGRPDKLYGGDLKSNYQGQGVALAKNFKPWPH